MKRIGIITVQKVDNYGAELQAYALFYALQKKGYDVEMIDYLYVKHTDHIAEKKSIPYAVFSRKQWFKLKIIKLLYLILPIYRNQKFKKKKHRFSEFYNEMKFSPTYRSYSDLYNAKMPYDVYIVGSDQVWNPATMTSLDPFFLTFAPKDAIKISYASSFGVSELSDDVKEKYKLGLNNISKLSCREVSGVKLIKELVNKEASLVLDPTLLLTREDWVGISKSYNKSPKTEKYILIYTLNSDEKIIEFANLLKQQTGWKIYQIRARHIAKKNRNVDLNIFDAGPAEFVDLFINAEFILTNSFHGTVFPIILERPFYTILARNSNNNSRQEGILNLLGLEDRLFYENDNFDKKIELVLDFTNASKKLCDSRNISWSFLESSIDGIS